MKVQLTILAFASAVFLMLSIYYYIKISEVIANWDSSSPQGFTNSLNELAKAFTVFAVTVVTFVLLFLLMILEQ
jgi:hypothetical protein